MGVVPRAQSKLLHVPHARRGNRLLQNPQNLDNAIMKRDTLRCRGAREKGAIVSVEFKRVSQEDTMEPPL